MRSDTYETLRRAAGTVLDARTELLTHNLDIQPDHFRWAVWEVNYGIVQGILETLRTPPSDD